jgi:hypothetical protein
MDTPTTTDDSLTNADEATRKPNPLLIVWFGALLAIAIYLWCTLTESFIADDSYFYVVIARNIAIKGQQTFSNVFPTNGFHPLWGYVLAGYTFLVNLVAPAAVKYVTYAVPLAIAMLAATAVQSWRLARAMRLDPLVITSLLVGYVVSLGMLYSEGPLFQLLLVSLLVMMARDPEVAATRPIAFGLLTAAIVLVRLDSIFFVGFVYLYYLWKLRLAPRFIAGGVLCGLVVGGYVLSNIVFFGGMMPISGWLKGNFPHPYIRGFVSCPFPRLQLATIGGYSLLLGWMPLAVGFVTLVVCRPIERIQRVLLLLLWAGTTFQGVYIALFTRSHTLWPWYYVLPVTLLAISLAILSDWWRAYYARAAVLAAISLAIVFSLMEKTSISWSPGFPAIEHLNKQGIHGKTVLISDWPGAVAFYTDNNIVAADMLTSNRFEFDRMRGASNALDYLVSECKRLDKPIEQILMVGSNWLEWDDETEEITYFDPRRFPVLVPIGKLKADYAPSGELQTADGIKVWLGPTHDSHDATNIRPPVSAPPAKG